ncbi:Inner membrane protein YrbG [Zhongshania aliphaticivorans]|uniref:Inner membrane protein YrbG n=1 Tax=Zhongshania aliphaticivorans TaxID=1470434 RepID=A0A5S9PKW3_9GAMM|nr:calcium/sodium antiporter [Zhongshania aliphaticivorans]CAA0104618.1 Inner membrane protein YrbG [Zhongshania aliphaticivorans]CAA0104875.1 Inner membrane protein YrbG [Zhongshania aliphaticivorans]
MLLTVVALVVGLVLLVWSADRFVIGASATASILGVSPLVVGILIVGIGTSAPEMLVSAIAAADGQPGLAVGNALGSNITNIALILGFTALLIPLKVQSKLVTREIPLLILVMLVGYFLLSDGDLGFVDGSILLIGFVLVVVRQIWEAKHSKGDSIAAEFEAEIPRDMPLKIALMWLLFGFVLLIASARVLVWSAVEIAQFFGLSDLVIGLTVVAIGTSLPELAASVAAARKNEHDIAIGNVVGSNLFNLLGVMALPGVIAPGAIDAEVMSRDYPVMLLLTGIFFLVAFGPRKARRISRVEGGGLLAMYVAYLLYLLHDAGVY